MVKATSWANTMGFSDRIVRAFTGCSIDQIPRNELKKGTVLKTLMHSRSDHCDYFLVIADGSTLRASDPPTGDPRDYEIVIVPQIEKGKDLVDG